MRYAGGFCTLEFCTLLVLHTFEGGWGVQNPYLGKSPTHTCSNKTEATASTSISCSCSTSESSPKIASLEGRTTSIEQNVTLILARLQCLELSSQREKISLYICEMCDHESRDKQSLITHRGEVHTKKTLFHCGSCTETFSTSLDLELHDEQVHIPYEIYSCRHCQFSSQSNDSLQDHILQEHGYPSRYYYSQSRRIHSKNQPPGSLQNVSHKVNSEKRKQLSKPVAQRPKTISTQSDQSQIKCQFCKEYFGHKDEYDLHKEYFHAEYVKTSNHSQ